MKKNDKFKQSNKKYYTCFSPNLSIFLIQNGFVPIYQGVHSKTQKIYWVFKMDKDLSNTLKIWSNNKSRLS